MNVLCRVMKGYECGMKGYECGICVMKGYECGMKALLTVPPPVP
jgi:hypothetical protein